MKLELLRQLSEKADDKVPVVEGTNCSSCSFYGKKAVPVKESDLDPNGGILPANDEEKERAKKADLLSMPGSKNATEKHWCDHDKVKQYVSERQCCAFWTNNDAFRSYGKQVLGE